jgi:hypothetical protein
LKDREFQATAGGVTRRHEGLDVVGGGGRGEVEHTPGLKELGLGDACVVVYHISKLVSADGFLDGVRTEPPDVFGILRSVRLIVSLGVDADDPCER